MALLVTLLTKERLQKKADLLHYLNKSLIGCNLFKMQQQEFEQKTLKESMLQHY